MDRKSLKVLQIIKGFDIGGPLGGAENFGINLSQQLAKEGGQIAVCSFYRYQTELEEEWYSRLIGQGIPVIFASDGRKLNLWHSYKLLQEYCRKNHIQIVHSHFQVASLVVAALKLTGAARHVIRTAHTPLEWGRGAVAWVARLIFTNWVYPFVFDAEVGVSESIVNQLKKRPGSRLSGKQPLKIFNALSPEFIDQARQGVQPKRRVNFPGEKFVMGSVGRLVKGKGYEYLLDVLPSLKDEIPQLFCVIIGEGELRPKLEEKSKQLGITDWVKFLGKRSDILDLLCEMDLFVLPSLMEGLSTVILESMACHIPVIATGIPGTREIIQDQVNGWLVNPADTITLHQAILDAYHSPEKREAFSQQAKIGLDRFSITQVARQYRALYLDLRV